MMNLVAFHLVQSDDRGKKEGQYEILSFFFTSLHENHHEAYVPFRWGWLYETCVPFGSQSYQLIKCFNAIRNYFYPSIRSSLLCFYPRPSAISNLNCFYPTFQLSINENKSLM